MQQTPNQNHRDAATGKPQIGEPLYDRAAMRRGLGGMSVRKFAQLIEAGVVPPPLEVGPRSRRWTQQDFEAVVSALPRSQKRPEPAELTAARRAKIEALKAAGQPAASRRANDGSAS